MIGLLAFSSVSCQNVTRKKVESKRGTLNLSYKIKFCEIMQLLILWLVFGTGRGIFNVVSFPVSLRGIRRWIFFFHWILKIWLYSNKGIHFLECRLPWLKWEKRNVLHKVNQTPKFGYKGLVSYFTLFLFSWSSECSSKGKRLKFVIFIVWKCHIQGFTSNNRWGWVWYLRFRLWCLLHL